jgi:hypothetical protein
MRAFPYVSRLGRSSDNEVYERVVKVPKGKVLAELYWLVKYNVLYQEYDVVIDPSNLYLMGDENECILPISCKIHTEQDSDADSSPEDDKMGPSDGQTFMGKLDQILQGETKPCVIRFGKM